LRSWRSAARNCGSTSSVESVTRGPTRGMPIAPERMPACSLRARPRPRHPRRARRTPVPACACARLRVAPALPLLCAARAGRASARAMGRRCLRRGLRTLVALPEPRISAAGVMGGVAEGGGQRGEPDGSRPGAGGSRHRRDRSAWVRCRKMLPMLWAQVPEKPVSVAKAPAACPHGGGSCFYSSPSRRPRTLKVLPRVSV
jgi:hypothetical protein